MYFRMFYVGPQNMGAGEWKFKQTATEADLLLLASKHCTEEIVAVIQHL